MFDAIQRSLKDAIKKLRGRGRITEENVAEGLQLVRTALLEADVNYTVAGEFIDRVKAKAIGQQVLRTIDPSEQIVQIIYQELIALMRAKTSGSNVGPPSSVRAWMWTTAAPAS